MSVCVCLCRPPAAVHTHTHIQSSQHQTEREREVMWDGGKKGGIGVTVNKCSLSDMGPEALYSLYYICI